MSNLSRTSLNRARCALAAATSWTIVKFSSVVNVVCQPIFVSLDSLFHWVTDEFYGVWEQGIGTDGGEADESKNWNRLQIHVAGKDELLVGLSQLSSQPIIVLFQRVIIVLLKLISRVRYILVIIVTFFNQIFAMCHLFQVYFRKYTFLHIEIYLLKSPNLAFHRSCFANTHDLFSQRDMFYVLWGREIDAFICF